MITHKVAELTGYELNMAVARAEGLIVRPYDMDCAVVAMRDSLEAWPEIVHEFNEWKPSSDWAVGGPIIERESIALYRIYPDQDGAPLWRAGFNLYSSDMPDAVGLDDEACGPTPLIAAMRAFVTLKLGETVELP